MLVKHFHRRLGKLANRLLEETGRITVAQLLENGYLGPSPHGTSAPHFQCWASEVMSLLFVSAIVQDKYIWGNPSTRGTHRLRQTPYSPHTNLSCWQAVYVMPLCL